MSVVRLLLGVSKTPLHGTAVRKSRLRAAITGENEFFVEEPIVNEHVRQNSMVDVASFSIEFQGVAPCSKNPFVTYLQPSLMELPRPRATLRDQGWDHALSAQFLVLLGPAPDTAYASP